MNHPHRKDALVLLATLLNTTPTILEACINDRETAEGLRTIRQLEVCERYTEALLGRPPAKPEPNRTEPTQKKKAER